MSKIPWNKYTNRTTKNQSIINGLNEHVNELNKRVDKTVKKITSLLKNSKKFNDFIADNRKEIITLLNVVKKYGENNDSLKKFWKGLQTLKHLSPETRRRLLILKKNIQTDLENIKITKSYMHGGHDPDDSDDWEYSDEHRGPIDWLVALFRGMHNVVIGNRDAPPGYNGWD